MLPGASIAPPNEYELYQQNRGHDQNKKKKILVYFIGGVTYAEVAAIRFLNKMFKDKYFMVATTQMINGDTCMEMIRGKLDYNLDILAMMKKWP